MKVADGPALVPGAGGAQAQLVLDRGRALQVGAVAGVEGNAQGHSLFSGRAMMPRQRCRRPVGFGGGSSRQPKAEAASDQVRSRRRMEVLEVGDEHDVVHRLRAGAARGAEPQEGAQPDPRAVVPQRLQQRRPGRHELGGSAAAFLHQAEALEDVTDPAAVGLERRLAHAAGRRRGGAEDPPHLDRREGDRREVPAAGGREHGDRGPEVAAAGGGEIGPVVDHAVDHREAGPAGAAAGADRLAAGDRQRGQRREGGGGLDRIHPGLGGGHHVHRGDSVLEIGKGPAVLRGGRRIMQEMSGRPCRRAAPNLWECGAFTAAPDRAAARRRRARSSGGA